LVVTVSVVFAEPVTTSNCSDTRKKITVSNIKKPFSSNKKDGPFTARLFYCSSSN
jgi:hypothetical protein